MFRFKRVVLATCAALSLVGGLADEASAAPLAPATPAPQVYVVQSGDYLAGIAVKLGVKLKDLLRVNDLTLNSLILPGRRLVVPAGGTVPTGTATSNSSQQRYVVVPGDSLYGIALKLKVKLTDLLAANRLDLTSLIYPGMKLTVPAGGSAPAATGATTTPAAPSGSISLVYVVVAGDSLSGIAGKLRVALADLLAANSLRVTSTIHPGTRLTVPPGGVLPATTPAPTASGGSGSSGSAGTSTGNASIDRVLAFALAQLGKAYQFNAAGPDSFDCSGLTMAAFAEIGISLPHYSGAQVRYGTPVDWANAPIRPGDLVFLESSPGSGVINHVGIATSTTQWVQAPRTGEVVRVGAIPMYRVVAVRRLVGA